MCMRAIDAGLPGFLIDYDDMRALARDYFFAILRRYVAKKMIYPSMVSEHDRCDILVPPSAHGVRRNHVLGCGLIHRAR